MNAMSLKAKIRNIAKAKNISVQVVLQNFFFERFLIRLSQSEYHEKFILKGGLLIATWRVWMQDQQWIWTRLFVLCLWMRNISEPL
jgi:hypothetical protein